jgi:hypothetical protein
MFSAILKFIPAVGLLGLAVYHLSKGDLPNVALAISQAEEAVVGVNSPTANAPAK